MAEEEQEEKARKVREMQKAKAKPDVQVDPKELQWALGAVTQLNEALKVEDFRRPHHQLWKMVGPHLLKKDSDEIFGEIRQLVWEKWNAVAWQHGYRTSWDTAARKKLCARIVDIANTGKAPEVKKLIKEIEDRVCLEWPEIPEAVAECATSLEYLELSENKLTTVPTAICDLKKLKTLNIAGNPIKDQKIVKAADKGIKDLKAGNPIEESNKLRATLGIKPLREESKDSAGSSESSEMGASLALRPRLFWCV